MYRFSNGKNYLTTDEFHNFIFCSLEVEFCATGTSEFTQEPNTPYNYLTNCTNSPSDLECQAFVRVSK